MLRIASCSSAHSDAVREGNSHVPSESASSKMIKLHHAITQVGGDEVHVRLVRATGEDDFVCDAEGNGREIDRSPMVSDTYVGSPVDDFSPKRMASRGRVPARSSRLEAP